MSKKDNETFVEVEYENRTIQTEEDINEFIDEEDLENEQEHYSYPTHRCFGMRKDFSNIIIGKVEKSDFFKKLNFMNKK